MPELKLGVIWAQTSAGVIGAGGAIPWHIPEDFAHFRHTTTGHTVVMGRATWDSLNPKFRPLPGRHNIVLTRSQGLEIPGATVVHSLPEALDAHRTTSDDPLVWVMGGSQIYHQVLPYCTHASITYIDQDIDGDTYAPKLGPTWGITNLGPRRLSANGSHFQIVNYRQSAPLPLDELISSASPGTRIA